MPCLDWTKIFISYIDVMNIPDDRRKELQSNYYFTCECVKCCNENEQNDMNLGLCEHCGAGVNFSVAKKVCDNCKLSVSNERLEEFNEIMDLTKQHLTNMQDVACNIGILKQISLFINFFIIFFHRFGCL